MGDPKRIRKKYSTPGHPWNKARLDIEKELVDKFGLKNKKEIWKASAILKDFSTQAKSLIARRDSQADIERVNLLEKVKSLGLSGENPTIDDILALKIDNILERRLQTVVSKMTLSRSIGQARQFIVHRHICVNGSKVTVPSYLVKVGDVISFSDSSALKDENHPERFKEKIVEVKEEKEDKKQKDDKKKKKKVIDEEIEVDDNLLKVSDEEVEKKIEIEDDSVEVEK